MFENQRPGIYSRYEISGYYGGGKGGAALLLPCPDGEEPWICRLESYHQGLESLAENPPALNCLRLLFGGGAGSVDVIFAHSCEVALEELAVLGGIRVIVSGFTAPGDLRALRGFAEKSAGEQRECLVFAGMNEPAAAIDAAADLDSGRIALCCPAASIDGEAAHPLYGACALAAAVLSAESPIHNFNGEVFPMLSGAAALPEDTVQALLKAGVCVFENAGEGVELIRAVTTGSGAMRSLNTVLIIDDVMGGIRDSLRQKLRGPGRATLEGIRDQVAVELAAKKDAGILASFQPPRCRPDQKDPGVCVVELSFGTAHLLSQIHLTAHIRV